MALYEYRCLDCDERFTSSEYGLENNLNPLTGHRQVVRIYSFAFHRPFDEHYNPSVGSVVRSKRDLNEQLARKSEEITERTGIPHQLAQADLRDRDIFPVTEEGLGDQYNAHDPSSPVRRAIETVK